ncbi:MAG: hypothetical protein IJZ76_06405 [Lachnospiraceae bacterium]|nr:hypothetical protein [Lachnospiraceae bacterium]
MYIYKELVTDDACKDRKSKIIHKIRKNAGLVNVFLICLAGGNDSFDIIDCSNLKQKGYPRESLYVVGMAEGKESAIELSAQLFLSFSDRYGMTGFKKALMDGRDTLFRRY